MSQTPEAVMMFAAGFGTRMGALTRDVPKPLLKVAGRPLIDHALDLARGIKPKTIVANLHYKPDQLASHLSAQGVLLSLEEPEILETGGGLRAALPMLGHDPVFTMNTDAIWVGPNPLKLALINWDPKKMDALLVCIPKERAIGYHGDGDFRIDEAGRISRGPGLVFGGVQILKTKELKDIKETSFSLNLLWSRMQENGRLFAVPYPGRWCDVGHPEGIDLAERLLRNAHV